MVKLLTPYVSQWESPSKIGDILLGKLLARQDPLWKNSGAISPQEYEYWSWNICGIVCLKMVLVSKKIPSDGLVALAKDAAVHHVFDTSPHYVSPLKYKDFCRWVKRRFNLTSHPDTHLDLKKIISHLDQGHYVIASVSGKIKNPKTIFTDVPGGHLVLLVGYDTNSLYLHNPSGCTPKMQKYAQVTFTDFEKFFAHRGIIVL